jgi:hypothetical protein
MNTFSFRLHPKLIRRLQANEVQYDASSHRLYVQGGEGYMGIYDTSDPDHLKLLEKVTTAPGAKTGLLLPGMHRLSLAVSPGGVQSSGEGPYVRSEIEFSKVQSLDSAIYQI